MKVMTLSDTERDAFLRRHKQGVLSTLRVGGEPFSIPILVEWNGEYVEMYSTSHAGKVKRLRKDSRASVLVMNNYDEDARWVSFEGNVSSIALENSVQIAKRLTAGYTSDSDADRKQQMFDAITNEEMVSIRLYPRKIVTYAEVF